MSVLLPVWPDHVLGPDVNHVWRDILKREVMHLKNTCFPADQTFLFLARAYDVETYGKSTLIKIERRCVAREIVDRSRTSQNLVARDDASLGGLMTLGFDNLCVHLDF